MKSERVVNWWCGFEWWILNIEKLWSSNKFKKMKSLCNRWVSVWNPETSKEIVCFVHEVHPVFAVTISTFLHMLWSSNRFKKMKSLRNRWVSIWNHDTSKEILRFVHEVHPVFALTLSTFLPILYGWNDDTKPTWNLFRVHFKCFSISGSYGSK